MDIFKPFLDQKQVLATYRDGVTVPVEFLPTNPELGYGDSFPYTVTPNRCKDEVKTGAGSLYEANGNCYYRGNADITHISPMITQNDHYKAILTGLAEILVKSGPDDDSDDLKEEIYEYMESNCKEILDKAENEQDEEVERLRDQIKKLDSAALNKLLEQLHLCQI